MTCKRNRLGSPRRRRTQIAKWQRLPAKVLERKVCKAFYRREGWKDPSNAPIKMMSLHPEDYNERCENVTEIDSVFVPNDDATDFVYVRRSARHGVLRAKRKGVRGGQRNVWELL